MINIFLILCLLFYSATLNAGELGLSHRGLEIFVNHHDNSKIDSTGRHIIFGTIQIKNETNGIIQYSNKNLVFEVNGMNSRTYMDSIASQVIDFDSIPLNPNEEKQIDVYWVFNSPVSVGKEEAELQWAQ